MLVLQYRMWISKAGPSILRYMSDLHRNIETSYNSKPKLPKFNDLCIISTKKTTQR